VNSSLGIGLIGGRIRLDLTEGSVVHSVDAGLAGNSKSSSADGITKELDFRLLVLSRVDLSCLKLKRLGAILVR